MNESNFHERADDLLSALFEAIEIADEDGLIEAELIDGVLTIELEDGGEFVINKHEPSRQIWISSPARGAKHYSYVEEDDEWVDNADSFKDAVLEELSDLAGINVEF